MDSIYKGASGRIAGVCWFAFCALVFGLYFWWMVVR